MLPITYGANTPQMVNNVMLLDTFSPQNVFKMGVNRQGDMQGEDKAANMAQSSQSTIRGSYSRHTSE